MSRHEQTTKVVGFSRGRVRLAGLGLSAVLAASGIGFIATSASATGGAPGNNGTLKIHEKGTPSGTESNDPKVCEFNVEGFGFDAGQTGYLVFTTQGGDKPTGTNAGPYEWGPAGTNGYYATQYFNLDAGHYKATLYGKMLPSGQLKDEKAKSKVFKVKCGETPPPTTTTTPPTTTTTTATEHKLALTVEGCVGGEQTALVNGKQTGGTEGVDYSANISPDAAPLPTPVDADGTFSLVAMTTGPHTVTVTGSDGSSVSASVNVPACTTPPSSTTTTATSTVTNTVTKTATATKTSTSTKTATVTKPAKATVPVPASTSTTTKSSYPVAAHTGGSGDNIITMRNIGIAALALAGLILFLAMSRGRSATPAQQRSH